MCFMRSVLGRGWIGFGILGIGGEGICVRFVGRGLCRDVVVGWFWEFEVAGECDFHLIRSEVEQHFIFVYDTVLGMNLYF